ncbi:MAG: site-specific integrase [Candidatus Micrarchaeota archaeon]
MVYDVLALDDCARIVQDFHMGRIKKSSTIEVVEGVFLKQHRNGKWHYYFKVDGIQFRQSTKTKDRTEATQIALKDYQDAKDKKRSGKVVEKISFKKLVQKYLQNLKGQSAAKVEYHTGTIKRHLSPFFEKYDDISKINKGTINDYAAHRKNKSGQVAKNRTLNRESGVLNQLFKFGSDYGWCEKDLRFQYQSEKDSGRRVHFTGDEFITLVETSGKRIKELKALEGQGRGLLTNQLWARLLLHDIIIFIASCGVRVDELGTIRWKDIDWENEKVKLNFAGKTKSNRSFLVINDGVKALRRIKERRLEYLGDEALNDEERIKSLPNGKFIKSLKGGLRNLLEECGFKYKDDGSDKHTLTSLRHSYATIMLTRKKGERATIRGLAKQMGTSERMIEKHYGHDTAEDYRSELTVEKNESPEKKKSFGKGQSLEEYELLDEE